MPYCRPNAYTRSPRRHRFQLGLRLIAAIPGGYALSAASVATLAGLLAQSGMARSDAVVLSAMLGFVLYLVLLLWAFAVRSVARLWAVIAGGLAACGLLLWLMPMGA